MSKMKKRKKPSQKLMAKKMRKQSKKSSFQRPSMLDSTRPPVVEDGFRIVGPSQAMLDFGKPIVEVFKNEDPEVFNLALQFVQFCWNLAVTEDDQITKQMMKEFQPLSKDKDIKILIDSMIERHHLMFPTIKQDKGFHIRERVIDEPEPVDEAYFDESSVIISAEIIPANDKDRTLFEKLTLLEDSIRTDNEDYFEKHFENVQDRLIDRFEDWCHQKGATEEQIEHFCFAVNRYIDFLYGYQGVTLGKANDSIFDRFMTEFWIRKTWAEAESITAMPMALKLFYQFLKEKEFIKNDKPFQTMINRYKAKFLNAYKAYQQPG